MVEQIQILNSSINSKYQQFFSALVINFQKIKHDLMHLQFNYSLSVLALLILYYGK